MSAILSWICWIFPNSTSTNSIGLVLDIVGAWLVAWEVVRQYRGKRSQSSDTPVVGVVGGFAPAPEVTETPEYVAWEKRKYLLMKLGLLFLTLGFVLQIVSNWCR